MHEHVRLPGQQLGDFPKLLQNDVPVVGAHGLSLPRHHAVFQKVIEFPHQQRDIETPMKGDARGIARTGSLRLHLDQSLDGATIQCLDSRPFRRVAGFGERDVAEIFKVKQSRLTIIVVEGGNRDSDGFEMRPHIGEG